MRSPPTPPAELLWLTVGFKQRHPVLLCSSLWLFITCRAIKGSYSSCLIMCHLQLMQREGQLTSTDQHWPHSDAQPQNIGLTPALCIEVTYSWHWNQICVLLWMRFGLSSFDTHWHQGEKQVPPPPPPPYVFFIFKRRVEKVVQSNISYTSTTGNHIRRRFIYSKH